MTPDTAAREPLILTMEQARACLEGTHTAGRDGRPIPTAGPMLLDSYGALLSELATARQALRLALDCKGSGEGLVSKVGGYPAICTACEETIREALLDKAGL